MSAKMKKALIATLYDKKSRNQLRQFWMENKKKKTHALDDDELTISMFMNFREHDQVVLRNTHITNQLEKKTYCRYQIIKPKGFENEVIWHREDCSYEALLAVVFMTLAEATKTAQNKNV